MTNYFLKTKNIIQLRYTPSSKNCAMMNNNNNGEHLYSAFSTKLKAL